MNFFLGQNLHVFWPFWGLEHVKTIEITVTIFLITSRRIFCYIDYVCIYHISKDKDTFKITPHSDDHMGVKL